MLASLPFLQNTRRLLQRAEGRQITAFSQNLQVNLPPSNLLSAIDLYVHGTITTGTGTSGNWDPNFFPWNILAQISLVTNVNFQLFQASGYSAFLIDSMIHRASQNGVSVPAGGGFNNSSNVGPRTARCIYPSGALADSTAYKFGIHFRIPVTSDDSLGAGLVLLGNQYTQLTLKYQVGAAADFGALGAGASIAANIDPVMTLWQVPDDLRNYPVDSINWVHMWMEQEKDWTISGEQPFDLPVGGTVVRVIADVRNNGAPQPFFSSASDPESGNFGDTVLNYDVSQRPEAIDFKTRLQMMYEQYGMDLPQGVLVYDYGILQSLELGANFSSMWDLNALTQWGPRTTINVTPTAGKIIYITEKLQRLSPPMVIQ